MTIISADEISAADTTDCVKVKQRNAMVKLNISNKDARLSKLQTLPCKMPPQAVNSTGATPSAHKAW